MTARLVAESKQPAPDEIKLQLYAYYKQATTGDCNTPKPGMLDFVGKAKWEQWNTVKGTSANKAMACYIGTAVKFDPSIQLKISAFFENEVYQEEQANSMTCKKEGTALHMVEQ